MKLNATAEMLPVTWPEFGAASIPSRPTDQAAAISTLIRPARGAGSRDHRLRRSVAAAQRGLAGRVRRAARDPRATTARGDHEQRTVCLIPASAHGTNPAQRGDGRDDSRRRRVRRRRQRRPRRPAAQGRRARAIDLGALMVTYPSTHGVFEDDILDVCAIVHDARRPGLHGRREHQRAASASPPRRFRRRRVAT